MTKSDGLDPTIKPLGWIRFAFGRDLIAYAKHNDGKAVFRLVQNGDRAFWCFTEDVLAGGREAVDGKLAKMLEVWREKGMYADVLDHWRHEPYAVYADPRSSFFLTSPSEQHCNINHAFSIERAATSLFGIMTMGVQMIIYEGEGKDMKIWVPRRLLKQARLPGKLEASLSVTGDIPVGKNLFGAILANSEGGSPPATRMRQRATSTGHCSFVGITAEGCLEPRYEYTLDLQLSSGQDPIYVNPRPNGDVHSIELMPLNAILDLLKDDPLQFRPSSAIALMDFFVRHGIINAKNDPAYLEILPRCHEYIGMALPMERADPSTGAAEQALATDDHGDSSAVQQFSPSWWQSLVQPYETATRDSLSDGRLAPADDSGPAWPLHMTKTDGYNPNIKPIGWIRKAFGRELEEYAKMEVGQRILQKHEADGLNFWHFTDDLISAGQPAIDVAVSHALEYWRMHGVLDVALSSWRGELRAVYADVDSAFPATSPGGSFAPSEYLNHAFSLERAATSLFGLVGYYVHMTVYEGDGPDMMIWVAKRSRSKSSPGKFDNSVAGGLVAGMSVLDGVIKESEAEASLPASLVRERARPTGYISSMSVSTHRCLRPAIGYNFDLQMPGHADPTYVVLRPNDSEVESYTLMSASEILSLIRTDANRFTTDSAVVLVDFFVRHGIITSSNEPEYLDILPKLGRNLKMTLPVGRCKGSAESGLPSDT